MATTHTDEKPSKKKRKAEAAAESAPATTTKNAARKAAKKAEKKADKKAAKSAEKKAEKSAEKKAEKKTRAKSAEKKAAQAATTSAKAAKAGGSSTKKRRSTPTSGTAKTASAARRQLTGYARLVPAIERIVLLTEGHAPQVRRAVFDSYISAVVDGGAEAEDLLALDVREGGPDERERPADAAPAPDASTPEAAEPESAEPESAEPESAEPESAEPQAAPRDARPADAAADDRPAAATDAVDDDTDRIRHETRPRRRQPAFEAEVIAAGADRPATDLPVARTLTALAKQAPPSNNNQRNTVIVAWLQTHGHPVTPQRVAAAYERMSWRVPVNVTASLRTSIRTGLLIVDADDRILVSEAGAAHFR